MSRLSFPVSERLSVRFFAVPRLLGLIGAVLFPAEVGGDAGREVYADSAG